MKTQQIPAVMKKNALWCTWKLDEDRGKVPYNPKTGAWAKSNDPNTFADFNDAVTAFRSGEYAGMGIGVFNGFSAIDIDHCIDDGHLSDMAKDIIERMDSYTEISPSGKGIRIIFTIDDFSYNKDLYYIQNQKAGLEIYVSGVTNKFVTITGNVLCCKPVREAKDSLAEVLRLYMTRMNAGKKVLHTPSVYTESSLAIGLQKDKKLIEYWNGGRPKQSESENDMGFMAKLLYWTNGNVEEAIQAFLSSPYASQKDAKHKKKLEREDYLPRVANAVYLSSTAAEDHTKWQLAHKEKKAVITQKEDRGMNTTAPIIMSAQALQKSVLPPVRYLVEDILPEGTSILSAASKIGKSWLVLDMGMKIASGDMFMGKQTEKVGVLYFALEDSWTRLQNRMNTLLGDNAAPDLFYFATEAPSMDNGFLDYVGSQLKSNPAIKLIIIDTLQKIRGQALPRESAYQQDYREMGLIKRFADQHGISVFFVHHNRKMKDDSDPFNMISGTNGLMGAADTALVITKKSREDKDAVLHITGRDVMQSDLAITFDSDACKWNFVGDALEVNREEQRKKYLSSPIVKAIKALLKGSPNGKWSGNASKLIKEGEAILHTHIAYDARAVGSYLDKYVLQQLSNDGIGYDPSTNGNAGTTHRFYLYHRDAEDEDFEEVEF